MGGRRLFEAFLGVSESGGVWIVFDIKGVFGCVGVLYALCFVL